MKYVVAIVAVLLGALFIFASCAYFFQWFEMPPPPEGSPAALFFGAFYPTGYLDFVKVCELLGGILVAIAKTRRLGLLILGPIIVNILAFNIFIEKGAQLLNPMLIVAVVFALFLVWAERRAFAAFIRGG